MKKQLTVPKMFQELRLSVLNFFFKEKFRESFHTFIKRTSKEKEGVDLLKSCLDYLYKVESYEPFRKALRDTLRTMPEDDAIEKLATIAAKDDGMSDEEVLKMLRDRNQHNTFLFV
jgi:hypothetical protein